MSAVLRDMRQGELWRVERLGSNLIAVGPVHLLESYADRLGDTAEVRVNGSRLERPCCVKCGATSRQEDLWWTGEGLLCFSCYGSEFIGEPQGEPVSVASDCRGEEAQVAA